MEAHTLLAQPATRQVPTPTYVIKNVGSLCHKRPEIGLLGLVNTVWAIVIWQYTGLEDVRFVTATTKSNLDNNNVTNTNTNATLTYHVCAAHIDGGAGVIELVQLIQNGTKELTPDQLPLAPSRTDSINTQLLQSMTILSTDRTYLSTNTHQTSATPNVGNNLIKFVAVPSTTGDLEISLRIPESAGLEQDLADNVVASFSHVINLVMEAVCDNDRLDALDLVSQHDKTKLWAWNSAQLPETVEECVHTLFGQQAREQPDMPAVDAWDGQFTYAELDAISNQIAEWLIREERVQPESIVPLCFEKSCWAIAALMGVIKAGGAIVFIDPANPMSRRRDILDQIDGQFVLTSPSQAETWNKEMVVRTVVIDAQFVASLPDVRRVPESGVTPANLLYLIFTSGSTGKPKGCLIPHKAFVSGALQHAAKSKLGRGTRVMQLASYSFDVSMLEILTSLISGACVCTPDMASLAQGLHPIVQQFAITWAFLTPSMVKLLRPDLVPTLKTLALGGEPLHKIDIETWAPHLQLINGYGPTECSVAAAGDPHLTPTSDPSNIGRAVGGLCWIVDAENHDRLVPLGAVGELLISGPILARGYLNDIEKTATAFIENPIWTKGWSLTPEARTEPMRFYKTGDLARFNLDGTIQILGRKDTQVKLRGLRIELGEVEHNIAKHPHVKHVAAFLPKTGLCKEKIVAVVCLDEFANESRPGLSDAPISVLLESERPAVQEQADAVRVYLRNCVPEYMIPAVWIVIEKWPLLVSGKLDRKSVASWVLEMDQGLYNSLMGFLGDGTQDVDSSKDGEQQAEIDDGLSEVEKTLRDIFALALNTPAQNLPLDKSFIGLGGDSLAAMRVVSEAKSAGLTIKVKDMLQSKGIVDLAARVTRNSSVTVGAKAADALFPLSRAQTFLGELSVADSDSLLLVLDNTVSPTQLKVALGDIVARHSILTARFVEKDAVYSQRIASQTENSYRFEEHVIEKPEEIAAIVATAQRATTLSGPVFSADFIKLSGEQHLLLVAHRAVVDSGSWAIIFQDLETILNLTEGHLLSDKGKKPVSFQHWVEIERQTVEAAETGTRAKLPIPEPSEPDLDYWGVKGCTQTADDIIEQTTELDEKTVALLSGSKLHEALRTDAVDFLVASLLLSFRQTFADRESIPSLSVWEDERTSASQELAIDLATTVGQFEMQRVLVLNTHDIKNNDEQVSLLKRTKDARRMATNSIPANSQAATCDSEISLRYQDLSSVLDRTNALLRRETHPLLLPSMLGIVRKVLQTSIINIMADTINGRIQLVFSYNRHIKNSARIASWIVAIHQTLTSLVSRMLVASVEYTLSDFPLFSPLSYEGLDKLVKERLPQNGLSLGSFSGVPVIEDIYPCSPLQQDLLLSQNRSTGMYEYYHIAELKPRDPNDSVDVEVLARAWSQVVQRHTSLRTVFVESADGQALFDQIVLAHVEPNISVLDFDNSTEDVETLLANQAPITFRGPQPPHRMTICRFSAANHVVIKLDINHAIVDGASAGVLLRDILQAYDGKADAWKPALPFRNYIAHIRQTPVDPSLDFWVSYLRSQTATLIPKLATLETPGNGQAAERRLNVVDVPLASEGVSYEKLSAFCRGASVTPANVFQAAWALVLRHYAESPEDVCFGYLSAGRDAPLPDIQDGVGAFLTMLVSRLRFTGDGSKEQNSNVINTLLDAVQTTAVDYIKALPHQHVGLSNIQHALETGGSPLFNTIVAFNRDVESPADSSLLFKSIGDHEPDEYALVVDVTFAESHGMRATLRHWTDYLSTEQVRSIASAYGRAVEVIISHPETPIGEVSIVGSYHLERYQAFNSHPLPRADRLMFTRFEEHAREQPDAQAVCAWDGEWTYAQLDDVSTRLAHFLCTLGVGPEVIVPHCFPKSGWAVVTCLAILKAGGAFVGLDPTHPKKRLAELVQDTGAKVVCAAPENVHLFECCDDLSIVEVTPELTARLPAKRGRPCASIRPDNAACVVFTSGTTGRPKAVVVEHASMSTLSDLMGPAVQIGPEARVFQFASYTFDTSNQDTFTTLQRGGCLCVPSEEDRVNDPAGALVRLRANHAHLTSTVISLLCPETVPQLRWLFSAGESLTRENVEVWAPAVELYNSYGPAESSVAVTCTPTRLGIQASPANIGKSFGGWTWIVDATDHHKLVPLGAVGELLLEGPLLARHYLNDAAKTAVAFVENPRWAKEMTPGRDRRFYRTGDLCRFNSDGSLTIIGRRDTQIKIHGQRVELDHIKYAAQAQLAELGARTIVSVDALTLPRSQAKDKTLVAFVQFLERTFDNSTDNSLAIPINDTVSREFSDLQRALKTSLPKYMVPSMFVPITRTPRTNNGKLARNILRETVSNLSDEDIARCMLQGDVNNKQAPETEKEKMLQVVWAKVLSLPLEKVGANDDFFQIGGDSVVAMRLAAAARTDGMSLTVADIFANPILSNMAMVARTAEDEILGDEEEYQEFDLVQLSSSDPSTELDTIRTEAAVQCGVRPDIVTDLYPCTPLQEGLIALSMRQTGAYKDQRIFRLTDRNYDVGSFRRALDAVVRAEPILRTRFVSTTAGEMLQAVLNVATEWVDRSDLKAYLQEDLDTPVTYGSALIRLALIEENDGSRYVVWSGHHALCDGFSLDITFEQISHAMAHDGAISPRPEPFKNFIRYLNEQATDGSAQKFWEDQFPATGDVPPKFPPMPAGHQVVPHRACRSKLNVTRAPGSKISVTNYLRGAWGLVVAQHLDSPDVLFGVTLSGRNAPVRGISTMNGPTMTTVPFRMSVPYDGEITVAQYLESVHAQALEMTLFEHTGLQNIRRFNDQARAAIDNMTHRFAVEPVAGGEALEGMETVSAALPGGFYTDPLVIRNYAHDDGTIEVEAKYDYTLISDDEMQRLLRQYAHVVRQLLSEPNMRLADVELLGPEDVTEIMNWNGTAIPETVQECVHHLVAERTQERPHAEAVCAWDGSYTFAELDAVTERLAAHLQNLGVGPEVVVALCFDKSKWNVVSMLSILKAGGCYTALNPAYPTARMQDIIQDVKAPLVLCSPQHAEKFNGMLPHILSISDEFLKPLQAPAHRVTSTVKPSNMAFIVFTSGSTGKPKGAIIEHRGICSMQHYEGPSVGMGPDTRTLQLASHVFDVSNSEVFTTLMRGGCVCVPSEAERMNDLAGALNKYRVNWSFQVPTMADTLDPDLVPGLKYLALGGEAISQNLCDKWAGKVTLLNSYGPSECSIWTSVSHLLPGTKSPNNIGRGLGCRTFVTDQNDHNRLVAIGCVGELCVEGPIVSRGYMANPTQTAAAYIDNPAFAKTLGFQEMRMYRTGDLVKYDSDGTLLYVGRKDSQVKIRGQRIELGEVELNIIANDIEADAVAVEKIFQGGDKDRVALAAFFKLTSARSGKDSGYTSEDEENSRKQQNSLLQDDIEPVREQLVTLRRTLLDTIPPHMVPSFFIPLRRMPVTQTGKRDRKTLQALGASLNQDQLRVYALDDVADSVAENGGRPCTTEAEKRLRTIWAEVLGIAQEESISADDSFFLRGGDSIQAMRLAAAARRAGKTLAVADMFRMPRLFQMAELWERGNANSQDAVVVPFSLLKPDTIVDTIQEAARQCNVKEDDIEDIYLASPLQEGLMAVSTRKPGAYISTRIFDLPANIDIERFKSAWQEAADNFPILRTRVVLGRVSESLQVVLKEKMTWDIIDSDESAEAFLTQRGLANIEYGGRLCVFAIDATARKFAFALHHALYDGWSATVLLGAVEKIYKREKCPVGPGFNVFIRHLSQIDKNTSDNFWRDQLSGTPAHFPKLPNKTYEPKNTANVSHTIQLPASENQPIGILKSTLLRAAWALVSARHAESNDITFGAAQSGRDCAVPGIEEVVGPIVTTVPIRVRIDEKASIISFLQRIQEQSVAMIAHQHAGVQALRQLGKGVEGALEFTTLFEFGEDSHLDNNFIAEVQRPELLDGFWSYPIVMECHLAGDGSTVNVLARHDPLVVPTHQMNWICKQFSHVVGQLCSLTTSTNGADMRESAKTVNDIEVFGPEDKATVDAWNSRWPHGEIDGKTVHEAIAEHSRQRPEELALSGWDGDMTYAQLEHYAGKLAKTLVNKGVGPEVLVPLCFDKSKWAIVASVAVIKAGGVVVHLGPTHPANRRKEILQTLEASFVLVSPQHISLFQDAAVSTIPIDQDNLDQLAEVDIPLPQVNPSNAVYVCFTSGSTGRPKGIVVEHENLRMSAQAHGAQFKINPGTRVFQFSAYTFDIGLGDIFITLQRGATLCTPSEFERLNDLTDAINKYKANFMSVTPSVAKLLAPENVPMLRTLVLGGEAPTQDNVKTWSDKLDLVLIWGPAETTIYASATAPTTMATSAQSLGNPMGSLMWLCDPTDHNKLVPLGCVGEIVVEGPLVSRGYLKDEEKTLAAYIQDPIWAGKQHNNAKPRRMYKTGDLARYDANGYMLFAGRKDNQVKLHGQRMELEEIEHAMLGHETVRQAVARIPCNGPLENKLVAMLSLHGFSSQSAPVANQIRVLENPSTGADVGQELATVCRLLQDNLPSYMVPTIWICVEAVPLSANSKIDRKFVDGWLQELDQTTYESLLRNGAGDDEVAEILRPSTPVEEILCEVISRILRLESNNVNLNRSFLNLGGDSVSAMQLRSKVRKEGVTVTMQDIIKSKSIVELASQAVFTKPRSKEVLGAPFDLSPIQKMFFDLVGSAPNTNMAHFDQSILLQINNKIAPKELQMALGQVVQRHSMLRARYSQRENGDWYQYLAEDSLESFHFNSQDVEDGYEVSRILTSFAGVFNIQKGPVFCAHLFNLHSEQKQLLFVRAHHLVVDVVSWHAILGDLEVLIATGSFAGPAPLPFQSWLRMQKEMAESLEPADLLPFPIKTMPIANYEYWGMGEGKPNVYGDAITAEFSLDEATTAKLIGSSNVALNNAPVDTILAALIQSYVAVFPDRATPVIFSEGHGREPGSDMVDLSGTVGWFTTMSPLHVADVQSDIVTTVQTVKDLRRRLRANGMSYFSSRYLSEKGQAAFKSHFDMEIMFNYLGRSSEVGRENAMLSSAELPDGATFDKLVQDENLPRWSLFDVVALIAGGKARVTIAYNKNMQHQDKIKQWITTAQTTLSNAIQALDNTKDMPININLLSAVEKQALKWGINPNEIEEIYPCAGVQGHMLTAREKHPDLQLYEMEFGYQITGPITASVDVEKLKCAWQNVVHRHAALRTVLVPSASRPGSYEQVVLRNVRIEVPVIECASEQEMKTRMDSYRTVDYRLSCAKPHHQLTLFVAVKNDEKVVACKMEIDHVLTDGVSMALLLRDFELAYDGILPIEPAPSFGSYASWLDGMSQEETLAKDVEYWTAFDQSTGASHIPRTNTSISSSGSQAREYKVKTINLDQSTTSRLPAFCAKHGVTMAAVFQTAWGLVLQELTGSNKTLFAFMTANRDAPVTGAGEIVGPLINMLLCRTDLSKQGEAIGEVLGRARDDFLNSLEHQYGLAKTEHMWQDPSWNSLMSLQYMDSRVAEKKVSRGGVQFEMFSARDPVAWDVSIGLQISSLGEGITAVDSELGYWSDSLTDTGAGNVKNLFEAVVKQLLEGQ